jgi:transcription elongation factor Elf1
MNQLNALSNRVEYYASYVNYYNETRTHKALDKDSQNSRVVQLPSAGKKIIAIPHIGGLHHRYERRAA